MSHRMELFVCGLGLLANHLMGVVIQMYYVAAGHFTAARTRLKAFAWGWIGMMENSKRGVVKYNSISLGLDVSLLHPLMNPNPS